MHNRLVWFFTVALLCGFAGTANAAAHDTSEMSAKPAPKAERRELGASAAWSTDGTLWVARRDGNHVVVQQSADHGKSWSETVAVNSIPEAIAADGDSRPKIAIGPQNEIYVTWTTPLAKPYTGNIRFSRSVNGGKSFDSPITVNSDRQEITHRFDALTVSANGTIYVTWIDKRDQEIAKKVKRDYRGAAIYTAVSTDRGGSFSGDRKIADHSCECCRIAAATDANGVPWLLWRHVFEPNQRDHALAKLSLDGIPVSVGRATFDRWQVDGCPHHGPSLAIEGNGTRHAVWFNVKAGQGHVFYGRLVGEGDLIRVDGQQTVGGERAAHADIAVSGQRVAIAWKEFDGEKTRLRAQVSTDGGVSFRPLELASADGISDQPRLLKRGELMQVFWRTEREGMRLFDLP
jgi:hypothetical protein